MCIGPHGTGWQVFGRPRHEQATLIDRFWGKPVDLDHQANFIACVRSRKTPNADAAEAHRSALLVHYANMSYRAGGQKLQVDAKTEEVDSPEAMKFFRRDVSPAVGGGVDCMLNIAILGAGAIPDSHIAAYLKRPAQARVVALVDLFPEKAAEKVARHGLQAKVFKTCDELLAGCDFDAASICLPPYEHAAGGRASLRAGKHVLTEKPMATCLEECDQMLDAAARKRQRAGRRRAEVASRRRDEAQAGAGIGHHRQSLHSRVDSFWWRGGNYYDLWWRGTWAKEGGGCTMNHAVHQIDLFLWMMGPPAEVQSVSLNLAHENSEVEDFSASVVTFANGGIGQITAALGPSRRGATVGFPGRAGQSGRAVASEGLPAKGKRFSGG